MNRALSSRIAIAALALTSLLVVALGGCASQPVPNEQMAVATAAVARANTSSTSLDAPTELQRANDKLASARQALANNDNVRAEQLAQEAQLDAQVAELHAQTVRSRRAAKETQDAAQGLREELNRKTLR